jgi:hypothetical protein
MIPLPYSVAIARRSVGKAVVAYTVDTFQFLHAGIENRDPPSSFWGTFPANWYFIDLRGLS